MPPPRSWVSPPTRRELTLLLFSLTVYVLSYNLETSLRIVGVSPAKLSSPYLSTLGLGAKDPGYDRDGRRPAAWRDALENLIVGEWTWDDGQIAGVERGQIDMPVRGGQGPEKGPGFIYNAGAQNAGRSAVREHAGVGVSTGIPLSEQFLRWGTEVPETTGIAHVPGFTILENVLMLNGTFVLVTDSPSSLPPLSAMGSSATDASQPPRPQDWMVLSTAEARTFLGTYGGRIHGTTWVSTDVSASQDPYVLFSLYHTHNALMIPSGPNSFISSSGLRIISPDSQNMGLGNVDRVPAPSRLMFPHVPTFASPSLPPPNNDPKEHPPLRVRSYNGLQPQLLKAILPTVGVFHQEDFKDLADMSVPFVFDRLVISDRGAAQRGRDQWTAGWKPQVKNAVEVGNAGELKKRDGEATGDASSAANGKKPEVGGEGKPVWAAPFVGFEVAEDWWAPARAALRSYLGLPDESELVKPRGKKGGDREKPVLTYVSTQAEPAGSGPRLRAEDHAELVKGLRSLQETGVLGEIHIVRGNGSSDIWEERMEVISRSNIILGPYGLHLADSIFMPVPPPLSSSAAPNKQSQGPAMPVLMEFFPPGTFIRDQEFAVRSLGMRYVAWWNDRKFTEDSLPAVMGQVTDVDISLNPGAVLQAVREEASRLSSS